MTISQAQAPSKVCSETCDRSVAVPEDGPRSFCIPTCIGSGIGAKTHSRRAALARIPLKDTATLLAQLSGMLQDFVHDLIVILPEDSSQCA